MTRCRHALLAVGLVQVAAAAFAPGFALAQRTPGHPIGTVSTRGELIILQLDPGVIAQANLFDLEQRTLRFTPDPAGYRVETSSFRWDPDVGREIEDIEVTLRNFSFPFSGSSWSRLNVNPLGSISFGGDYSEFAPGRFQELREAGPAIVNTIPVISVFLKPRMSGFRYVKEMADRLVVTWSLTEPVGGIFDFTFSPTTNRFQAVLHRDGRIDLSWDEVDARDAIVGIFTVPPGGAPATAPVDLSAPAGSVAPSGILYEAFHWHGLPHTASMACSVISALGDHFDFMVWYSDFRVDNQEAGTPSTGGIGSSVTGLGRSGGRDPAHFCSHGRIQATFVQPVYIGSNQGMERAGDGSFDGYNYALSQISHELGHRWAASARAIVAGDTIDLGPTHWTLGLHAIAPFPYRLAPEASTMGGGVWRDNGNRTYTLLADNYYTPASGYSHFDLYLMGLLPASAVPEFFLLRNLEPVDRTSAGHRVYKGEPLRFSIEDVIAYTGPRLPAFDDAQREYSTAMVAVVLDGQSPSPELLERLEGIRLAWIDYWSKTTGGLSTMRTEPGPRAERRR